MKVSTHYRLTGTLPFVDVHLEKDNELYVDPSAIRNDAQRRDAYAMRAQSQLLSFFGEVVRHARSSTLAKGGKAEKLLHKLHEPNETRLGLSESNSGHAFGKELGSRLWGQLLVNPACQNAVLNRLEDLPLFIEQVGPDLVSDLTTRVVFDVLGDFTRDMISLYPDLGSNMQKAHIDVWSDGSKAWVPSLQDLPFVEGRQLLLVPKKWVYWRLVMNPVAFYNRFSTQTLQEEQSVRGSDGKLRGPSKKALKEQNPEARTLNVSQAVKYKGNHARDLVGEYRSWIDEGFEPMSDADIGTRID